MRIHASRSLYTCCGSEKQRTIILFVSNNRKEYCIFIVILSSDRTKMLQATNDQIQHQMWTIAMTVSMRWLQILELWFFFSLCKTNGFKFQNDNPVYRGNLNCRAAVFPVNRLESNKNWSAARFRDKRYSLAWEFFLLEKSAVWWKLCKSNANANRKHWYDECQLILSIWLSNVPFLFEM